MWTLVLRAEILEDLTVKKHIHVLEKDVEGTIHTPHTKFEYNTFIEVAQVLNSEELVQEEYKELLEEQLTQEELEDQEVQVYLDKLKTIEED